MLLIDEILWMGIKLYNDACALNNQLVHHNKHNGENNHNNQNKMWLSCFSF
jgi:hypothetical protein